MEKRRTFLKKTAIATTSGKGTAVLAQFMILFFGWSRIKLTLKDFVWNAKVK